MVDVNPLDTAQQRSLFDQNYRVYGIDFGSLPGRAGNKYGEPRTFGLHLTYNFTAF